MSRKLWILAVVLLAGLLVWFVASIGAGMSRPPLERESTAPPRTDVTRTTPVTSDASGMVAPAVQHDEPTRALVGAAARSALRVRVVDLHGAAPESWMVEVRDAQSAFDEIPVGSVGWGKSLALIRGSGAASMDIAEDLRRDHGPLALKALVLPTRDTEMMVSDAFVVGPNAPDVIALVVVSPTRLTVDIDGPRPSGELRLEVTPSPASSSAATYWLQIPRTMGNSTTFEVPHSISYRVSVRGSDTADVAEAIVPAIARGDSSHIVLRFPGGFLTPVPEGYAELALAGRVEGAADRSAGLWAAVDDGLPISIDLRPDGTFELWHRRAREVELHAASGEFESRFDPEVSTHAFGARDVIVQARTRSPEVQVRLRIVAAESGAPIPSGMARLSRYEGDRMRSKTLESGKDDVITSAVPVLRDIEFFACARGRRDTSELLFDSRSLAEGEEYERTIRLTSGFARDFRVVHCSARTPIAGAEVAWNGRILGRSDADGRVRIELDEWPDALTVTAPDHDTAKWPSRFEDPIASFTIALCPAD